MKWVRIYYLLGTTYYGINLIEKIPEIKLFYITIPVNITYFFILLFPILFVFTASILIAAVLFKNVWMIILLLVPRPVLFTYIPNIKMRGALEHLIRLPKYKDDTPLRNIDKLIKWMVWPVIIAYLEWLRFNELDTEKKYDIAIKLGYFGGIDALIRAMKEEDINARLGVTDALEKLIEKHGDRVLKKVIKFAYSGNPIVRLSVATVLSNMIRNNPEVIRNNPKAESVLDELKDDPDPKVRYAANRNREAVFQSKYFRIEQIKLERNGKTFPIDVIERNPVVFILPLTPNNEIYLVSQYRDVLRKSTLEVVAGTMESNEENPLKTAKRELQAETGLTAQTWKQIATLEMSANSKGKNYVFIATNLKEGKANPDDDENIQVVKMPFDDAVKKAINGEIEVALSVAAILLVEALKNRKNI